MSPNWISELVCDRESEEAGALSDSIIYLGNRILIQDVKSKDQLSEAEKAVLQSCKNVTTNLLRNHKAENYNDMMADLIQSYKAMGCNVLKGAFLDSNLDVFPENLRVVRNEHRQ
jgi:hypothetical protein